MHPASCRKSGRLGNAESDVFPLGSLEKTVRKALKVTGKISGCWTPQECAMSAEATYRHPTGHRPSEMPCGLRISGLEGELTKSIGLLPCVLSAGHGVARICLPCWVLILVWSNISCRDSISSYRYEHI